MRHYCHSLRSTGRDVVYFELNDQPDIPILSKLAITCKERKISRVHTYCVSDRWFRDELLMALSGIQVEFHDSPGFMTSPSAWAEYERLYKRRLMADFYQWQRKRLKILLEEGKPAGGRWSFDLDNRKPLPKGLRPPELAAPKHDETTRAVIELVEREFPDHPGSGEGFWLAADREGALHWLNQFFEQRLENFGPYEDAISKDHDVLFHSVLSPYLNTGLLTPKEVVERALKEYRQGRASIASTEGFVRQIIGWREFIRGMADSYADIPNYFGNTNRMRKCWWNGTTGLLPLDTVIRKAEKRAYVHHIERLMILGSAMLLCETHPEEVYRWFMEMFVDSADWVMLPNVLGMSQYGDGGLFATKPYISGSAYLRRMSDFPAGEWCETWDALYWRFLLKNGEKLEANPRMRMMVQSARSQSPQKQHHYIKTADAFIQKVCFVG
jgi:deoxyribodipyrimidine photolyase-related protein